MPKSKCEEDDTIKLIETSKNDMLNMEKAFIRPVDTSPEKVIMVASNQKLTDLAGFCTDPRNFILSVLTLHIMLDHAKVHLRHIGSYNL